MVPDANSSALKKEMLLSPDQPVPAALICAVGDAVHNMRSALDFLTFAVAKHNGLRNKFLSDVSFTIRKDRDGTKGFSAAIKERKVARIGSAWVRFLESVEPYHGGKGANLYVISALDNIDKHRKLIVLAMEADRYRAGSSAPFQRGIPLEQGVKLSADPAHPDQKTQTQIRVSIHERRIPGLDPNAWATVVLAGLAASVEDAIGLAEAKTGELFP
jgi:hypothetical protein